MITPYLQSLLDAPLADPGQINLPQGKRKAHRGPRHTYEDTFAPVKLTPTQLRERQENALSAKIVATLDYYATTDVPFERIAQHTKMTIEQVERAMKGRGRLA